MHAIYISHNGMLEGLGQAQVLPYLRGLARRGATFDLLSYEFEGAERDAVESLSASLERDGIRWHPVVKRRDPRMIVKLGDATRGIAQTLLACARKRPDVVHGRSYLPTAIGDVVATTWPRAKLVFDCRGMLGDEYVDAGHWTRDRREYKLIKRYEARAFSRAEGVVVLTEALRRWITPQGWFGSATHVEVIPCCVDVGRFHVDAELRRRRRAELGLTGRLVVVYSGSLGAWYMEDEIARFAAVVKARSPTPVSFLLLSHSPADGLRSRLVAQGFDDDAIVVRHARPAEVASYLAAGDLGVSLIRDCFSKMGSSPTKVAEYLACGLPVVVNAGVGDIADLSVETDACVVLDRLDEDALAAAADRSITLASRPFEERARACRSVVRERFDLERVGVARYARLYEALARRP